MSCGGGAAAVPARPTGPTGYEGALVDALPTGATLVVIARPRELHASPAVRRLVAAIVSDDRFDAYAAHTGIDIRRLDELVFAEFADGVVLAIRGPFGAPMAVMEMGAQMVPLEERADEPWPRRVGHYAGARRDVFAIGPDALVAVTGDVDLSRRARAATGAPARASPESACDEEARAAPFRLIAPQPLGLPPGSGVALLLARQETLCAWASGIDDATIAASVDLRGEFPDGAGANFRALFESLADSDLGGALGMRDALPTLGVDSGPERVVLHATVPARALAEGLRVVFSAEIEELVERADDAPRPSP